MSKPRFNVAFNLEAILKRLKTHAHQRCATIPLQAKEKLQLLRCTESLPVKSYFRPFDKLIVASCCRTYNGHSDSLFSSSFCLNYMTIRMKKQNNSSLQTSFRRLLRANYSYFCLSFLFPIGRVCPLAAVHNIHIHVKQTGKQSWTWLIYVQYERDGKQTLTGGHSAQVTLIF